MYSNSRGGWNKRRGDAKVAKSINVEGWIFRKKLVHNCNKRGEERWEYKILSFSKLAKNCKQISQCVCVRPTKRETRFFVISLTASSGHEAKSSSSRDMVATNFSCKKKEEDRIDDKTCTIDKVSRQFCVYFERIFEYHTIGLNYSYNCGIMPYRKILTIVRWIFKNFEIT